MYDSLSRLIRAKNPEQDANSGISLADPVTGNDQWCYAYTYDATSNLATKIDPRNITTDYDYDSLNRVTSRTYLNGPQSTPSVLYFYDNQSLPSGAPVFDRGASIGRLIAVLYGGATSASGTYMGYDAVGQAVVSLQKTDAEIYQMTYGYNLAGNLTGQTYPSGRAVTTTYDGAGRVSGVTGVKDLASKTYASSFSYAAHGAVREMILGNSLWEHTIFNSRLQPTRIGLGSVSGSISTVALDYGYGTTANNGNVLSQDIRIGTTTISQAYTYDQVDRLASAVETSGGNHQWRQDYGFDIYGNRWVAGTSDLVPDPTLTPRLATDFNTGNNRIQKEGFGYDPAGNLTGDPETGADAIDYDAENKQISYTRGGVTTAYAYDGDGHRVKKVSGGVTTVFVYNVLGQLIAEYNNPDQPSTGGTSYLTTDHLGSTRVVTEGSGFVKARYDYLPFGEEIGAGIGVRTLAMNYSGADATRQKFTQKERDNESGLEYFGARYYSSAQGRFTSPDDFLNDTHVDDPPSWNLYVYVRNNPLKYIDPFGEEIFSTNLTDEQKKKLIEDLKNKTGYQNIYFDKNNKLVIDTAAGFKGGSADARKLLLDAVTSSDNRFNLAAVDSRDVGFARVDAGTITQDATGKRVGPVVFNLSIDFKDFDRLSGDREAKAAFTLGIATLHEVAHKLYGEIPDTPNNDTNPGPVETRFINPIRRQLGLAERVYYTAKIVPAPFNALIYNNSGRELKFNLSGRDKVLRWRHDLVGGRVQ